MRPSFRNLFMKKLTRDRVVPIISASVSWLIFARIGSGFSSSLPKFANNRSKPGQPFLTRIEQLIDEVCLDADGPSQKMGNEHPGERWFPMDHADNSRFFQAGDDGVRHPRDRRYALRLPGKTSFTEEIVRSKHCDDGFLALLRNNGDLHLAALDVEDRIRRVSLGKDDLVLAVLPNAAALANRGEKRFRIERGPAFGCHDTPF